MTQHFQMPRAIARAKRGSAGSVGRLRQEITAERGCWSSRRHTAPVVVVDASEESVEELADTEQSLEAASVEGSEDAADYPERPVHTHTDYGRPDDVPPRKRDDEAA